MSESERNLVNLVFFKFQMKENSRNVTIFNSLIKILKNNKLKAQATYYDKLNTS